MSSRWSSDRLPLAWRITLLGTIATALVCVAVGVVSYLIAERVLISSVDTELKQRMVSAESALRHPPSWALLASARTASGVAIVSPDHTIVSAGRVPLGDVESGVINSSSTGSSIRTYSGYRVLCKHLDDGATIVLSRSLASLTDDLSQLALILTVVGCLVTVAATLISRWVATTGLRPLRRFMLATRRISRSDTLTPLPEPPARDEIGELTTSFNKMLEAIDDSRARQRRLITDAAAHLDAPLSTLRAHVRELIETDPAASKDGAASRGLSRSVIDEIDDVSAMIKRLIDIGRDPSRVPDIDAPPHPAQSTLKHEG
ncbi:MAG: HAMP domain-containing protein [Gordonia sp. (in: high G+C Gram-positive bacteria)]